MSNENAAIIHLNIISQAGHRIVYGYIDITLIENKKQKVLKCVVCNKMSFFNSISCGHVIFGCCYVRYFKLINYLQFNSYYTKCPGCMEMIKCSEALTISQEIEKHPKSNPSLFYKNALIHCDNNGCNQNLSLSNWYKHIKFNCEYRIVNCPAIECSVKGNPNDILTHSI